MLLFYYFIILFYLLLLLLFYFVFVDSTGVPPTPQDGQQPHRSRGGGDGGEQARRDPGVGHRHRLRAVRGPQDRGRVSFFEGHDDVMGRSVLMFSVLLLYVSTGHGVRGEMREG